MSDAPEQLALLENEPAPDGLVVRLSGRAKHLSINVRPRGRVEIVVPRRTPPRVVEAFVAKNRAWIEKAVRAYGPAVPVQRTLPTRIALAALGREWAVEYDSGARVELIESGETLRLRGKADSAVVLKKWLQAKGREYLTSLVEQTSRETGLAYKRVQVRGQRTRWGSYSSSGTVSLNYCVLFMPPEAARYLVVHELCHSRHANHSKRFWRLVAGFEPEWQRLDALLETGWRCVPDWVGLT